MLPLSILLSSQSTICVSHCAQWWVMVDYFAVVMVRLFLDLNMPMMNDFEVLEELS